MDATGIFWCHFAFLCCCSYTENMQLSYKSAFGYSVYVLFSWFAIFAINDYGGFLENPGTTYFLKYIWVIFNFNVLQLQQQQKLNQNQTWVSFNLPNLLIQYIIAVNKWTLFLTYIGLFFFMFMQLVCLCTQCINEILATLNVQHKIYVKCTYSSAHLTIQSKVKINESMKWCEKLFDMIV